MAMIEIDGCQSKKTVDKIQRMTVETTVQDSPEAANTLKDLLNQAHQAYASYLEAQKKVAAAFKQRERRKIAAKTKVEQEAQAAFDDAIQKAVKVRTDSRKAYEESLMKAAQDHEGSVALQVCRQTLGRQWQASRELVEQIWQTYQSNSTH